MNATLGEFLKSDRSRVAYLMMFLRSLREGRPAFSRPLLKGRVCQGKPLEMPLDPMIGHDHAALCAPDGVRPAMTFAFCRNGKLGDCSSQLQVCLEKLISEEV
jgi:hypothetical protein